jgi:hypothetical protein
MSNTIELMITISEVLKKEGIVRRELQVLEDGILSHTINIPELGGTQICPLSVDEAATITIELRDIDKDGGMSAPLVYEFVIVDDFVKNKSDIFDVKILRDSPCD